MYQTKRRHIPQEYNLDTEYSEMSKFQLTESWLCLILISVFATSPVSLLLIHNLAVTICVLQPVLSGY